MRALVKCLNCGIKWVRVITFGPDTVLNEDIMLNCPNCNSNYYETCEEEK